jgi:hypothetical protein
VRLIAQDDDVVPLRPWLIGRNALIELLDQCEDVCLLLANEIAQMVA